MTWMTQEVPNYFQLHQISLAEMRDMNTNKYKYIQAVINHESFLPGNWKLFHCDTLISIKKKLSEILSPKSFLPFHFDYMRSTCFSAILHIKGRDILVELQFMQVYYPCVNQSEKNEKILIPVFLLIFIFVLWFFDFFFRFWYIFSPYSTKLMKTNTMTEKWEEFTLGYVQPYVLRGIFLGGIVLDGNLHALCLCGKQIVLGEIVLGWIVLSGIVLVGIALDEIVLDGKSNPPVYSRPPVYLFQANVQTPRLFQTPLIFRT